MKPRLTNLVLRGIVKLGVTSSGDRVDGKAAGFDARELEEMDRAEQWARDMLAWRAAQKEKETE